MEKAKRLWSRFLLLAEEETRLNRHGIGEREKNPAYLVNVFTSSGIRKVRAMQILKDLQKILDAEGITQAEFLASQGKALQG